METQAQELMETSSGQAKYEHQHKAIVWRIPRLPKMGQGILYVFLFFYCIFATPTIKWQITLRLVVYHFSSRLMVTLNLSLIYFKITWALAILLEHMHKKFEINRTKIKGGCQLGRKVVTHNSKSDLPLGMCNISRCVEPISIRESYKNFIV